MYLWQAVLSAYVARQQIDARIRAREAEEMHAAVTIQAGFRGHKARRHTHDLRVTRETQRLQVCSISVYAFVCPWQCIYFVSVGVLHAHGSVFAVSVCACADTWTEYESLR